MLICDVDDRPLKVESALTVGQESKIYYTRAKGDIVMRGGVEDQT